MDRQVRILINIPIRWDSFLQSFSKLELNAWDFRVNFKT